MHQDEADLENQRTPHNSLFIEIRSHADAITSRDRAAIAGSLLCIFSLIGAATFFLQGASLDVSEGPEAVANRYGLFVASGVNIVIIVFLALIMALIAYRNSRIAAAALLGFAVFDAGKFTLSFFNGETFTPNLILGLIIGAVARFFIVVTALNSLQGVNALNKFKSEASPGQ